MISRKTRIQMSGRLNRGFTFLEIMFVVVIIGVLLAVAVPRLTGKTEKARIRATELQIRNISMALKEYEMEIGSFPQTNQGLEALIERPSGVSEEMWTEPFLDSETLPKDSWNKEFHYRAPGEHHRDFDLWSAGPDGVEGNEDDVKNWTEKD